MKMVEVKTADLIGPALDWAVANAAGLPLCEEACQGEYILVGAGDGDLERYSPSTDWSQCGPLIAEHGKRIGLEIRISESSASYLQSGMRIGYTASTVLIAACRAIVAAKLGDVVSVPDGLVDGGGL